MSGPDDGGINDEVLAKISESIQQSHAERNQALLEKLTPREKTLITEAAVAAYTRAAMRFGGLNRGVEKQIPNNNEILAIAVDTANTFPDLYPTLSGYQEESNTEDSK